MGYVHHTVENNENRFPQVDLSYYQVLTGSETVVRAEPFHIHCVTADSLSEPILLQGRDTTPIHYELIFYLITAENLLILLMIISNYFVQMHSDVYGGVSTCFVYLFFVLALCFVYYFKMVYLAQNKFPLSDKKSWKLKSVTVVFTLLLCQYKVSSAKSPTLFNS